MTERYGSGAADEGQRPSGRGAVAERLARQSSDAREIDLTDEAAAREAGDDQADRESSGAFEPAAPTADPPAADTRPGSSNIFDVEERDRQEELHPTGYEPPLADADATPTGDTAGEPGDTAEEAADTAGEPRETAEEAADITPTPVPVAEPPADAPAPHGLPEPAAATDVPAAGDTAEPAADGEAPAAAGTAGSLLEPLDAGELRNRFLDIQAGFVDEPRQAVEEAGRFVDDLVRQVADAIQQQRGQLTGATAEGSTEDLRLALRAYRQFVDRLLAMIG